MISHLGRLALLGTQLVLALAKRPFLEWPSFSLGNDRSDRSQGLAPTQPQLMLSGQAQLKPRGLLRCEGHMISEALAPPPTRGMRCR